MRKRKIIYRGDVKNLTISSLEISPNVMSLCEKTCVVHKNATFYRNRFGKIISFAYGTVLPSYEEAKDCLEVSLRNASSRPDEVNCLYVDYDKLRWEEVTYDDFKVLSKCNRLKRKR